MTTDQKTLNIKKVAANNEKYKDQYNQFCYFLLGA